MPRPKNPILQRLCEDTQYCLTQRGNPCGIPARERQELRDWYVRNCGGTPELVARTRAPRRFPVHESTAKLAKTLHRSAGSARIARRTRALHAALGRELKKYLRLRAQVSVIARGIGEHPPKDARQVAMAKLRLVVLRDGCTEYYGYYDDDTGQCVYIGAGYVEGCTD